MGKQEWVASWLDVMMMMMVMMVLRTLTCPSTPNLPTPISTNSRGSWWERSRVTRVWQRLPAAAGENCTLPATHNADSSGGSELARRGADERRRTQPCGQRACGGGVQPPSAVAHSVTDGLAGGARLEAEPRGTGLKPKAGRW